MNAARTMAVFGVYLLAAGASFLLTPNLTLNLLGITPTDDPWIRIAGMLMVALGGYYLTAGQTSRELQRATVYGRAFVVTTLTLMVGIGILQPIALLFASIDLLGALWTAVALRHNDHVITAA